MLHYSYNELKIMCTSVLALTTYLADVSTELKLWEDLGLKALLLVAIYFLIKQLLDERKESKLEMQFQREQHRTEMQAVREEHKQEFKNATERFNTNLEAMLVVLSEVKSETATQTNWFKTVTRSLVEERLVRKAEAKQQEQKQQEQQDIPTTKLS